MSDSTASFPISFGIWTSTEHRAVKKWLGKPRNNFIPGFWLEPNQNYVSPFDDYENDGSAHLKPI